MLDFSIPEPIRSPLEDLAVFNIGLIPQPKHILIDKDYKGTLRTTVFAPQQCAADFLSILGYTQPKPNESKILGKNYVVY